MLIEDYGWYICSRLNTNKKIPLSQMLDSIPDINHGIFYNGYLIAEIVPNINRFVYKTYKTYHNEDFLIKDRYLRKEEINKPIKYFITSYLEKEYPDVLN